VETTAPQATAKPPSMQSTGKHPPGVVFQRCERTTRPMPADWSEGPSEVPAAFEACADEIAIVGNELTGLKDGYVPGAVVVVRRLSIRLEASAGSEGKARLSAEFVKNSGSMPSARTGTVSLSRAKRSSSPGVESVAGCDLNDEVGSGEISGAGDDGLLSARRADCAQRALGSFRGEIRRESEEDVRVVAKISGKCSPEGWRARGGFENNEELKMVGGCGNDSGTFAKGAVAQIQS
jgi:hypothetical protein